MGNCCTAASSMEWAGEDWGSLTSKHEVFDEVDDGLKNVEKEMLLGNLRSSSDANGKVRIMISKKELAELLGGKGTEKHDIGAGHASAEQVLVRLINVKYHVNDHHRPWRPVLQSIPEIYIWEIVAMWLHQWSGQVRTRYLTSRHNKVFDEFHHGLKNVEERLFGSLRASSDENGKIKIMISKKQLAELLGKKHDIGAGGAGHASPEQVLVRLINAKVHVDDHHRPWRHVLHSIPEVN